jgi:hypothetical protein
LKLPASSSTTRRASVSGELVVNGAGLRKKAVFKVYAMALYLPEKSAPTPRRCWPPGVASGFRSVCCATSRRSSLSKRCRKASTNNHSEAEMAGLKDRLKQFSDSLLAAGEPKTGTSRVHRLAAGERAHDSPSMVRSKGKDIAGEDFYKALLKIWLGNKPVQDDLKQALLGKVFLKSAAATPRCTPGSPAEPAIPGDHQRNDGFSLGVCCDEQEIHPHRLSSANGRRSLPQQCARRAKRRDQLCGLPRRTPNSSSVLPLRPAGTPFQRRVWQQIAAIPTHHTRSYGEIAQGTAQRTASGWSGLRCQSLFRWSFPAIEFVAAGGGLGGFARQTDGFSA